MKYWQETYQVFSEMARLAAAGRNSALAEIIKLEGSAYRQPGAKLLVRDDGTMIGNVSGGCLENDVREIALDVMKTGKPRRVHYDTSGRDDIVWGMGVGCNGKVDILVQPAAGLRDVLQPVLKLLEGDRPFALAMRTDTGETSVVAENFQSLEKIGEIFPNIGKSEIYTEILQPPPHLVVCGAGDDAMPMVRLAAEAGFRVTVVDHRPAYLAPERFPGAWRRVQARPEEAAGQIPAGANTLVVVKSHILNNDKGWVNRFAAADVPYIGLLGARSRRDDILSDLNAEQRKRVYGPVGLDLGAQGPEQIAVSIVAELMAVWSKRKPQHLRDRAHPIHEIRPRA